MKILFNLIIMQLVTNHRKCSKNVHYKPTLTNGSYKGIQQNKSRKNKNN